MICIIRQKYFCPLFCWPNLLSCLCPTWKTILFSSHFLHPRPENVTRSQTDQLHNTPAILNYFCSSFLMESLELVNFVGARVSGYCGKLMRLNFSWKVTFFFSCYYVQKLIRWFIFCECPSATYLTEIWALHHINKSAAVCIANGLLSPECFRLSHGRWHFSVFVFGRALILPTCFSMELGQPMIVFDCCVILSAVVRLFVF